MTCRGTAPWGTQHGHGTATPCPSSTGWTPAPSSGPRLLLSPSTAALTLHVWQRPPLNSGWKVAGFLLPQDKQLSVGQRELRSPRAGTPYTPPQAAEAGACPWSCVWIKPALRTASKWGLPLEPHPDVALAPRGGSAEHPVPLSTLHSQHFPPHMVQLKRDPRPLLSTPSTSHLFPGETGPGITFQLPAVVRNFRNHLLFIKLKRKKKEKYLSFLM